MPGKLNQFGFAPIVILVIVLLGLAAGVYLVGQTQIFTPKADLNLQPETSLTLNTKNNLRSFKENETFKVKIIARSDIDTARKVLAEVKYDPTALEVVNVAQNDHSQFNNDEVVPAACLLQTDPTYSDVGNKCNLAGLNTVTFRCGGDTQDRVKTVDRCVNNAQLYREAVKTCETSLACRPAPSPSATASASPSPDASASARPTPNPACSFAAGYPSNYSDTGSKCNKAGLNTVTFRCGGDTQDRTKVLERCTNNKQLYNLALDECKNSQVCRATPTPTATASATVAPTPKNFVDSWYKNSLDETAGLIILGAQSKNGQLKTVVSDREAPVMASITFRAIKPGATAVSLTGNSAMYNGADSPIIGLKLNSIPVITITALASPSAKPTPNIACTFAAGYPSSYSDTGSKCKKAGLNTITFRCGGDTQDRTKTVTNCVSNSALYQEALKVCKSSQACLAN